MAATDMESSERMDGQRLAGVSGYLPDKKPDCYIGIKACGCYVAVVFDDPRFKKDTAETVAEFIKEGYRVESRVWSEVQARVGRCKCPKKADNGDFSDGRTGN